MCGTTDAFDLTSTTIVNLTSPNYPLNYPRNLHCYWLIRTVSTEQVVRVGFLEFSLANEWDFLSLGWGDQIDGSSLVAEYTGDASPSYVIVRDTSTWIKFNSHPLDFYFMKFFVQLSTVINNGKYNRYETCFVPRMSFSSHIS